MITTPKTTHTAEIAILFGRVGFSLPAGFLVIASSGQLLVYEASCFLHTVHSSNPVNKIIRPTMPH